MNRNSICVTSYQRSTPFFWRVRRGRPVKLILGTMHEPRRIKYTYKINHQNKKNTKNNNRVGTMEYSSSEKKFVLGLEKK